MSWTEVFGIVFQSEGAEKVKKDIDDVNKKTKDWVENEKKLFKELDEQHKKFYQNLSDQNKEFILGQDTVKEAVERLNYMFITKRKTVKQLKEELKSLMDKNGKLSEKEIARARELEELIKETDQLTVKTEKQTAGYDKLINKVVKLTATYIGFRKVISGVMGFAGGGEDLALMAQKAGISADMLQKYGYALKNYGGGTSSAASTLARLNSQIQDLKFGKGGAIQNVALRYGISVYGKNGLATADEMLYNIAHRMEKLNTQAQLDLGKKLGLDPATLALVQGGVENLNKELEKATEMSLYSDEDIKNSREFMRSLRELQGYLAKIGAIIWRSLLPPLKWVVEKLKEAFEEISHHEGAILAFFGSLATVLGLVAVKGILAGLAITGITAPLLLLIAKITLFGTLVGIIVDDVVTALQGGESVIGSIVDGFMNGITAMIDDVAKSVELAVEDILILWNKLKDMWNWLKGKFGFGDDEIEANITAGRGILSDTTTPLSTMTALQNATNTNNTVQVGEVNIQTQATDATGIADSITNALKLDFQSAMYENTGGVK